MENTYYLSADAAVVARLIGLFVPILVALITKRWAGAGVKGVTNFVASMVLGGVVYMVDESGDYDWQGFVNGAFNVFVVSIAAYYGVLKPSGTTQAVANKTANVGIGSNKYYREAA